MADRVDQTSILVPIPKSGDLQDCNNYRNVSLICHASWVLLHIILNRLRQYSERQLAERNKQGLVLGEEREMHYL